MPSDIPLSVQDQRAVHRVQEFILTAASGMREADWRRELVGQLTHLLGADAGFSVVTATPDPADVVISTVNEQADMVREWSADFLALDVELHRKRVLRGVHVYHGDFMERVDKAGWTLFRREYLERWKLNDLTGLSVPLPSGPLPAFFNFYHERHHGAEDDPRTGAFGPRARAILAALRPALAMTVDGLARGAGQIERWLQTAANPIWVVGRDGRVLHRNAAAAALAEDEVLPPVRRAAKQLLLAAARDGTGMPETQWEVSGRALRGMLVSLTPYGTVAMLVAEHAKAVVSDAKSLTPRQLEVAQLLSLGCATSEIADRLSLSRHTVRRHVEAIMRRMGVRRQAEVLLRLHGLGEKAQGGATDSQADHHPG